METNLSNKIIFINAGEISQGMQEYAKMVILLAFNEHPNDFTKQCSLIKSKFEQKYKSKWCCSISTNGALALHFSKFFLRIKYGNCIIKIWRHSE